MNWLQRTATKVMKIPQEVYPQLAVLMDRSFDQYINWHRNPPGDRYGKTGVRMPFGEITFESPYTFEKDSIPVFLNSRSSEVNSIAQFNQMDRIIDLFPPQYSFESYLKGQLPRSTVTQEFYESFVHEFTHAIDPKLDYRHEFGAKNIIDRAFERVKISPHVRGALLRDIGNFCSGASKSIPDMDNMFKYWASHKMKYMFSYMCEKAAGEIKDFFGDPNKILNRQQKVRQYLTDPGEVDAHMSMMIRNLELGLHSAGDERREKDILQQIEDYVRQPTNGPRLLPLLGHNDLQVIGYWKTIPKLWKKFRQRLVDFLLNYNRSKSYQSSKPRVIITPPPVA